MKRSHFIKLGLTAGPVTALTPATHASIFKKPNGFIEEILESEIPEHGIGAVASVVHRDTKATGAIGVREVGGPHAKQVDRARVASVTKGMIAVLVMQRVEAGQWSLETTIDQVVPGLYPGRGDVTVAQLMNHTSGMPDYTASLFGSRALITRQMLEENLSRTYSEQDLIAEARKSPWLFEPGQSWWYSNTGYVVLSVMLEEATGVGLPRLIRDEVFKPAGMQHSRLEESPLVRGRYLMPYAVLTDGEVVELEEMNPTIFFGAGGVYATAEDITDFTGALMRGELLPADLVETMTTPIGAAELSGYGYGLMRFSGVLEDSEGRLEPLIGHSGTGFGTMTTSLTTRDGSQRVCVAWTGRDWTSPNPNGPDSAAARKLLLETAPAGTALVEGEPMVTESELGGGGLHL